MADPPRDLKTESFLLRGIRSWEDMPNAIDRANKRVKRKIGTKYARDLRTLEDMPVGLQNEMNHEMNLLTVKDKIDGWMGNLKANMDRIVRACREQRIDVGIEGPAIVAGGSNPKTPMIRKQLHILQNGMDIPIVACDRAFSFLAKPGHVPEYAVVLENNRDPNYDFLLGDGRKKLSKDSTLYASIIAHPDILADWRGEIVLFRHDFPEEIINLTNFVAFMFEPLPPLWHGGNVGTAAYTTAVFLRANPIGLVGMDFGEKSGYVDPVKGHQFVTDPVLMAYAQAFSMIIKMAQDNGVRTVNCTEGGSLMAKHIELMTLEAFLSEVRQGAAA